MYIYIYIYIYRRLDRRRSRFMLLLEKLNKLNESLISGNIYAVLIGDLGFHMILETGKEVEIMLEVF